MQPTIRLLATLAVAVLVALASSCSQEPDQAAQKPQNHSTGNQPQGMSSPTKLDDPLQVKKIQFKHHLPGCSGDKCAYVEAKWVSFPDAPDLSAALLRELRQLATQDPPATLEQVADDFLAEAQPRWSQYLQAAVVNQRPPLVTIVLDVWSYTGGAHGIAATQYLTWDRSQKRALKLSDIVADGKSQALWQQVEQSYKAWRIKNHLDDAEARKTWQFVHTDNFMLGDDGLTLRYQAYSIGPHSMGQPKLVVPYSRLAGILRSAYLPASVD